MTTVLTLRLDTVSQALFEALRQRYYPAERNQIAAHLTLFHTLPDSEEIVAELSAAAAQTQAFRLAVTGLQSLGKGVAYTLASPAVLTLHAGLSRAFGAHLTAQDRQSLRPHVVIQNKVAPEAARELLNSLRASFETFDVEAVGLDLFEYLGGPWRHRRSFMFGEDEGGPGTA